MEILGSGAFGSIRYVHTNQGSFCEKISNLSQTEEIDKSLSSLYMLNHPNIIKYVSHYYESMPSSVTNLIVRMKQAEHGAMENLIHDPQYNYTVITVIHWGHQLFGALEFLISKQILHLNIKPSNVLLGSNFEVQLCDFNVCSEFLKQRKDTANAGSAAYSSPESNGYLQTERPTYSEDVYGAGIVIWECIERRHVFSDIRRRLDGFVIRGLLGRGELTVPKVHANAAFAALLKACTAIDATERSHASFVVAQFEKMHLWDYTKNYNFEPEKIEAVYEIEQPAGILIEPSAEELAMFNMPLNENPSVIKRGCTRSFAFKGKSGEKFNKWKLNQNEERTEPQQNQYEEVRWRTVRTKRDTTILPARIGPDSSSSSDDEVTPYIKLADCFPSKANEIPTSGVYEEIPSLLGSVKKSSPLSETTKRKHSKLSLRDLEISTPQLIPGSSCDLFDKINPSVNVLGENTEEWLVIQDHTALSKKPHIFQVGHPGFHADLNKLELLKYEDYTLFMQLADHTWKSRSAATYSIMTNWLTQLEKKQRLPLIRRLCLDGLYSRAAWCTFFCLETTPLTDIVWLGIADCLFRIIVRALQEKNESDHNNPLIRRKYTRFRMIHDRASILTKNEVTKQIWKTARFLLEYDMALFCDKEPNSHYQTIRLSVLEKCLREEGLPLPFKKELEKDLASIKEKGACLSERCFCVSLWAKPSANSSR